MESGQTLIDKAAEVCKSRYKLHQLTGESEGNLSNMARGKRPLPPRLAARLAAIAGIDPREAACAALLAQEHDPAKRKELAILFGLPETGPAWLHSTGSPSNTYTSFVTSLRRLFDGFSERRQTPR